MRRAAPWCRGFGAVVVLLVMVAAHTSPSGADSTFSASAGGELIRIVVAHDPPLLEAELLDPGALSAQAGMTSFGESTAYASNPYPGSLAVSLPGLVDGLLATSEGVPPELRKLMNLPEYPFIASSSYPTSPSSRVGAGPVSLAADSDERRTVGVATDGLNRTEARVVADAATDVVTATAVAEAGVLDLGPLLRVSGVRSAATVSQAPSGTLERTSEFSVGNLTILGEEVAFASDALSLGGLDVGGLLDTVLDPLRTLLPALAAHGMSLRVVEAEETETGVISAGLVVEQTLDTGRNGIWTVTVTLGRTFANVSNSARPPLGSGEPITSGPPPAPSGAIIGAPPGLDVGSGAIGGAVPPSPSATDAGRAPGGEVVREEHVRGLVPDTTDVGRFYPVLVLGGGVLAVGFSLFRKIGVSSPWT